MRHFMAGLSLLVCLPATAGTAFDTERCARVGEAHFRLAALRDNKAAPTYAISSVTDWLNKKDRTGSHLPGKNHRKQVTLYQAYVQSRPDMDKGLLYVHGKLMCEQAMSSASDAELEAYNRKLDQTSRLCLQQHGEPDQRKHLGECLERGLTPAVAANP